MKANEILQALNLRKSKENTKHCTYLANVYSFLKEIKQSIVIAEITDRDKLLMFGRHTEIVVRNRERQTDIKNEGTKVIADHFTVLTEKSEYTFAVPKDNSFYYAVCDLLNIPYEVKGLIEKKVLFKILYSQSVLNNIKKAAKFTSDDDLRPSMTCICLDFSDNELQVISTDAHRMYYSKKSKVQMYLSDNIIAKSFKPFQLLIQPESIKKLIKSKSIKEDIYIEVFNDNTALINGIEVNLLPDTKYPDFKAVIPEYKEKMTFDRAQMISNVKSTMVYANKSTYQVNLDLNGNIKLAAQDVDFSFESGVSMPYISKEFQDCEIGFNGKFLNEALSIFKSDVVSMYSEGVATRAAIFTDNTGNENVLLMPLMINN